MSLPPFETTGDLPVGVYSAPLKEISERFGESNARRKILMTRLERIFRIAIATGGVSRFIIFGSFITNKIEPNDIDIFMLSICSELDYTKHPLLNGFFVLKLI